MCEPSIRDRDSGDLCFLSRRRGGGGGRWASHCGGGGRTIFPEKARSRLSETAIAFCLEQAGLEIEDLDHVVFYEKPFLKFERILETYLAFAPRGLKSFTTAMPIWLTSKLHLSRVIAKGLDRRYRKRIIFPEHHESHAASAFFPSPFEQAAILTVDGAGEWATTTLGIGTGDKIELLKELTFPDSLGLLYSAFTYFCGFRVNGGRRKTDGPGAVWRTGLRAENPRRTDRLESQMVRFA